MSAMDFMHGSSFANALNSVLDTQKTLNNIELRKQAHEIIDNLQAKLAVAYKTDDLNRTSALGFFKLLEEEVAAADAGLLNSDRRLSGNNALRAAVRTELEKLASVDENLAMKGGRFSGNRIQNLRDVLHMRIDEFCEYGVKHKLISPDFKTVYTAETPNKLYAFVDENKVTAGNSPDVVEVVMLQRILNKNYDLAVDSLGRRPKGYPFKPVNLIAAVGFTVKQLCNFAGIDEAQFVGHKYGDPAPAKYMDPANDQAANLLQVEYTVLEAEADKKILKSKVLSHEDAEKMLKNVNATFSDLKGRVAAKISIVKYLELQAAIQPPEPKKLGAGQ